MAKCSCKPVPVAGCAWPEDCSRRSMVSGKASGDTTLSASGDSLGQIARSLHTTTRFNVGPATLLPGVGTALGARIGSAIGKLLGSQPEGKRRLAPVEK